MSTLRARPRSVKAQGAGGGGFWFFSTAEINHRFACTEGAWRHTHRSGEPYSGSNERIRLSCTNRFDAIIRTVPTAKGES